MRIAIVDDKAMERAVLSSRLFRQMERRAIQISVTEFANGETFLADARQHRFDLVFLDIYMEGLSGIRTAEALREFDRESLLVFTTSSTDHALEGYRVRAMQYLVKPYAEEELSALVEEILRYRPAQEKYLEARAEGRVLRLRYREILWAEHYQHRIYIHTEDGREAVIRQTFGDFCESMQDPRFLVCSRGVLVNLEYVADFNGKEFLLKNGKHIPVNRELAKTAQRIFSDYVFQRGHWL